VSSRFGHLIGINIIQVIPNPKAVLFDLDGTLVETDDIVVEQLAKTLRPIFSARAEHVARWLLMKSETPGNVIVTGLDLLGLDEALMSLTDRLRRRRGVYPANEFCLVSGVEPMIQAMAGNYKIGIVTTRSCYHVERFLEKFPAIADCIQVSIGLQDSRRLKPHPRPVLLASERLDVSPVDCLMVGDTTVDMKSARRAGAWAAGVLCGFGQREELVRAGAHVILDSTADLATLLRMDQP
jgi:phosphoglycolate phosphatase